jgi:hypothetical protein
MQLSGYAYENVRNIFDVSDCRSVSVEADACCLRVLWRGSGKKTDKWDSKGNGWLAGMLLGVWSLLVTRDFTRESSCLFWKGFIRFDVQCWLLLHSHTYSPTPFNYRFFFGGGRPNELWLKSRMSNKTWTMTKPSFVPITCLPAWLWGLAHLVSICEEAQRPTFI